MGKFTSRLLGLLERKRKILKPHWCKNRAKNIKAWLAATQYLFFTSCTNGLPFQSCSCGSTCTYTCFPFFLHKVMKHESEGKQKVLCRPNELSTSIHLWWFIYWGSVCLTDVPESQSVNTWEIQSKEWVEWRFVRLANEWTRTEQFCAMERKETSAHKRWILTYFCENKTDKKTDKKWIIWQECLEKFLWTSWYFSRVKTPSCLHSSILSYNPFTATSQAYRVWVFDTQ